MKEEVQRWIKQSEHDLGTARILLKENRLVDAAFYCQQAVEKSLKALMLDRTNTIRKIHDLVQLGKDTKLPDNYLSDLKELTLAYVFSRYPDVPKQPLLEERVKYFVKVTKKVLKWARENLSGKS